MSVITFLVTHRKRDGNRSGPATRIPGHVSSILITAALLSTLITHDQSMAENPFQMNIGSIIQAERVESSTGSRDIGGAIATSTGRIVIAASSSDGELNHPYKILISDDGGKRVREVFSMPASEKVTYHTLGLTYDKDNDVVISMFARNRGYQYLDRPYGKALPFSMDRVGDNEVIVALGWNDGETWSIDKTVRLEKPESTHGMSGAGVQVGDEIFFVHPYTTSNRERTTWRTAVQLACIRIIPKDDGTFTCDYEHEFRTLATAEDHDIPFSSETIYLEKVDGSGYLSFTRNQHGPPYRREYDLDHKPTGEFERVRVVGFDKRDYDPGRNGPLLIAFGIIRMADGNLLYGSRFYGTDHHRAGNILMTSKDEGKTWLFEDEYVPRSLSPLDFPNSGGGGNPQMDYAPDGTLIHLTSEGLAHNVRWTSEGHVSLDPPPYGGFFLCRFEGFRIEGHKPGDDGNGTISIDVSNTTRVDDLYIAKISVEESNGIWMPNEYTDRYGFSTDRKCVAFDYKVTGPNAFIQLRIVLANKANPHRPIFCPRINID